MNKFFASSALFTLALATTEIASTCIDNRNHLYGVHLENDPAFDDFTWLNENEVQSEIFRLTRIQLCEDANSLFVGMRAFITQYDANTMEATKRIAMNKIGTVGGTGHDCGSIQLDAVNGEYLTDILFAYQNAGAIDYVKATSNKGQSISRGVLTDQMTTTEMTSVHNSRILAFHGYENDRVSAVGQVSVDLGCIKGVTTTESVEEPVLIDIENIHHSQVSQTQTHPEDEHAWVYIMVGVILGVGIMTVGAVLFYMYKTRKGCFSKLGTPLKQTMPIKMGSLSSKQAYDLEFAQQTSEQKRRSMKRMSKIVEVDESADNEVISSRRKKANGDNISGSDTNQVQSLQSLAQVTDTEDMASKRQSQ